MRRWAMALSAILFLLLSMQFLASGARAADSGLLTVHARYCDPGVVPDDPYGQCHDNLLAGFAVDFDGAFNVATTGDDGNATFGNLSAGLYLFQVHPPLKATSPIIYCSVEGGDGSALDLSYGDTDAGVGVHVRDGESVICDWYWMVSDHGVDASYDLTIHARTCPTDQVPDDFFATCHDSPAGGLEYFVNGTSLGLTNDSGNIVHSFSGPQRVEVSGGVPGEFARNFIYCTSDPDGEPLLEMTEVTGSVFVSMLGAGTTCDWYIVPENLSGLTPTTAPVATSTPGAVTQLPNTGSGDASGSGQNWMLVLFALLAVMAGIVGINRASSVRK
jgi:hypothetical protein